MFYPFSFFLIISSLSKTDRKRINNNKNNINNNSVLRKEEEEDPPVLRIESMYQYQNSKTMKIDQRKANYSDQKQHEQISTEQQ